MERRTYTAEITKVPHGGYIAFAVSLHGVSAYGMTLHEAVENLREKIRNYLEMLALTNLPIPEDTSSRISIKLNVTYTVPAIT